MRLFHNHTYHLSPNQCTSIVTQIIDAPLSLVWSMVRRFDHPLAYKQFLKNCSMHSGDGGTIGSIRRVEVVSGLPAAFSVERLDRLDDDVHVMNYSIIGGDHKLANYRSTTTVHEDEDDKKTIVVESYVVDVPAGNSKEDTCTFVDTIIRCNLKSLAKVTETIACK